MSNTDQSISEYMRRQGRRGRAVNSEAQQAHAREAGKKGGRPREIEGRMVGRNLVVNGECPYCGKHVETSGDDYNGAWTCPECDKTARVRYA